MAVDWISAGLGAGIAMGVVGSISLIVLLVKMFKK